MSAFFHPLPQKFGFQSLGSAGAASAPWPIPPTSFLIGAVKVLHRLPRGTHRNSSS
jgi:hypothetical protein